MDGTLVVLSPHLDDAVFSVGAFVRKHVRAGARARVVTVFANDPESTDSAGSWDAMCGFESASVAAHARREEDRRACAVIGAEAHWLPFADESYGTRTSDDEIWRSVRSAIDGCTLLLVPGFPLRHADHARLNRLVQERRDKLPCALGFYAEQPYAAMTRLRLPPEFARASVRLTDRYAKLKASFQYRSQRRAFGRRTLLRALATNELIDLPPDAVER